MNMADLRNLLYSFIFFSSVISAGSQFNQDIILDVDEAFSTSSFVANNKIYVSWNIAPGYYLYKKSIFLKVNNVILEHTFDVSEEVLLLDDFFGESLVLKNILQMESVSTAYNLNDAIIEIGYQGCAEGKYCYPKKLKKL